jgi:hypothetical protein
MPPYVLSSHAPPVENKRPTFKHARSPLMNFNATPQLLKFTEAAKEIK